MSLLKRITVHAGDFPKNTEGQFLPWKEPTFLMRGKGLFSEKEKIPASEVAELEVVTEDNAKRFAGAFGLGLVGGVLLGPLGLLAGVLAGGTKKKITFVVEFKDGRRFLGTTDGDTYREILTAVHGPEGLLNLTRRRSD